MQPVSGSQYTRVEGTAGTVNIVGHDTVVRGVLIGSQAAGTVILYDNASGTSAATHVAAISNTVGTVPVCLQLNMQMREGLTVARTGTTDLVIIHG